LQKLLRAIAVIVPAFSLVATPGPHAKSKRLAARQNVSTVSPLAANPPAERPRDPRRHRAGQKDQEYMSRLLTTRATHTETQMKPILYQHELAEELEERSGVTGL
jgi:hypothetical protein